MASVDTSRLVVGTNGRTSFSGLGSGIDFQAAVDSMVEAKRVPIKNLEDKIKVNKDKIASYNTLTAKLSALKDAMNKLRGAISADQSTNIFQNKETFASSSRGLSLLYNPYRTTASAAASLIGVSADNRAQTGSHTIEVLRTARAQRDSSQVFSAKAQIDRSTRTAADPNANIFNPAGDITINGKTVTLAANQSYNQIRDAINGVADIGVTASVVDTGGGVYVLQITGNTPGSAIAYGGDLAIIESNFGLTNGTYVPQDQVQAALTSSTSALNAQLPGFTGGSFTINGVTITLDATNTLQDVRDRINSSNAGVTASILSSSTNDSYLVIAANNTGTPITYTDSSDVLAALGVLNNDDSVKNQLQAAQTALFSLDGLRDQSRKQSDIIYNPGATLATVAPGLINDGSFTINNGTSPFVVNYTTGMTLNQLRDEINAQAVGNGADVTASIETVEGGNGGFRLVIKDNSGDTVNFTGDTGGLVSAFSFTDPKILERTSNTISDAITGLTINLFAAEGGTTIRIDVERNLSNVKDQIANFVKSYNELVYYMNQQNTVDPITGKPTEETGILFGDGALSDVKNTIGQIISTGALGVNANYSALASIGIKFVVNQNQSDPMNYNTLEIDETKLDQALLNNAEDVRKLFTFDGQTNDARFTITGFSGDMSVVAGGLNINFTHDGTKFTAADIGGDSSAVEIIGNNTIRIKSGPGAGLTLFYNGGAASGAVNTTYTMGVGAKMFAGLEKMLTLDTGTVDAEIDTLTELNKTSQQRIDTLNERLEAFRQQQLEKFYKMEQSMSRAKSILDSITQSMQSGQKNN